jgi:hypothetical protein
MSQCTKCETNFVGTPENPPLPGLCKYCEIEILRNGIDAVCQLMAQSHGVTGLHLNGDVATWDDLRTGGKMEEWLVEFDDAVKILPPIKEAYENIEMDALARNIVHYSKNSVMPFEQVVQVTKDRLLKAFGELIPPESQLQNIACQICKGNGFVDVEKNDHVDQDECGYCSGTGLESNLTEQKLELLKLAVDNFLADGRPHGGRNTQFPDGCECDICQSWDKLNNARNNLDL